MRELLEEVAALTRDVDRLNGCWIVATATLGGVRLPQEALDDLTLVLHDGALALGVDRGRVAIDWDVRPTMMDVLIVAGPNRGRFIPAIVDYAEETLRICFDLAGRQRPRAFTAPPGTRRFLARYQRVAIDATRELAAPGSAA